MTCHQKAFAQSSERLTSSCAGTVEVQEPWCGVSPITITLTPLTVVSKPTLRNFITRPTMQMLRREMLLSGKRAFLAERTADFAVRCVKTVP